MYCVATNIDNERYARQLDEMFAHRKSLFVDTLKWPLNVVDDRFEKDQFDADGAIYLLVLSENDDAHLGSVRLLPSTAPHILGSIFPELCAQSVPRGRDIFEVSRLCAAPAQRRARRAEIRRCIATSLVEFGLLYGVSRYTCVADVSWLSQILAMGWECEPLGLPQRRCRSEIGALSIHVRPDALHLFWSRWGKRRTLIEINSEPKAA